MAKAEQLAADLLVRARDYDSRDERRRRRRVSRLLDDAASKTFVLELTDEIVRIRDPARAARRLNDLSPPQYPASPVRSIAWLRLAGPVARRLPNIVMPAVIARLRREFAGVVLPVEERAFAAHAARRRAQGIRLNVNVLGEAILGDEEAARRLDAIIEQLGRPEVDYVSVKISAVCAQLDVLPFTESLARVAVPVRALYDEALRHDPPKFVNLDMEEFRLELTTAVFRTVLDEPPYRGLDAGVLQAYLRLLRGGDGVGGWARAPTAAAAHQDPRRQRGNLAMESVGPRFTVGPSRHAAARGRRRELQEHARCVDRSSLRRRRRVGVASHNLFDVAWALVQREAWERSRRIEMLEGMANPQALAVREAAVPSAVRRSLVATTSSRPSRTSCDGSTRTPGRRTSCAPCSRSFQDRRRGTSNAIVSPRWKIAITCLIGRTGARAVDEQRPSATALRQQPDTDFSFRQSSLDRTGARRLGRRAAAERRCRRRRRGGCRTTRGNRRRSVTSERTRVPLRRR